MRIFYLLPIIFLPKALFAEDAQNDWNKNLLQDAKFIHDTLIENHPGYYDKSNPDFKKNVEIGYKEILENKADIDYGAYRWKLRKYAALFKDAHLLVQLNNNEKINTKWAGIISKYQGNKQIVEYVDKKLSNLPPIGSQLLSCDGKTANDFAFESQGKYRNTWFLQSTRNYFGDEVLVNRGNPMLPSPNFCVFKTGKYAKKYKMNYVDIDNEELSKIQEKLEVKSDFEFSFKEIDGGYWVSMPSFVASSENEPKIKEIINSVQSNIDKIKMARFFVFDVRGNGGGASMYPLRIAQTLWGDDATMAAMPINGELIYWRASKSNIEYLRQANSIYAPEVANGLEAALKGHQIYYKQNPWGNDLKLEHRKSDIKTKIYILTDDNCFSACLTAVDTFKFLGAKQIGQETGADTNYMDIRKAKLPSGMGELVYSMNMFYGRKRGINQTQKPDIAIDKVHENAGVLKAINLNLKK